MSEFLGVILGTAIGLAISRVRSRRLRALLLVPAVLVAGVVTSALNGELGTGPRRLVRRSWTSCRPEGSGPAITWPSSAAPRRCASGAPRIHRAFAIGWAVAERDSERLAYDAGRAGVAQLVEQRTCNA